ncbi:MAG: sn-glycerol-3-phosphate ABC transporter ATP-binding protein UgpC [Alphaproteobacteria bacterium]|nr:sn-glycerol-3-phosphate ABC transporter ATP-binding protein UgpC [Alphaproteobacteria bacterium]
MGAIELKSVEKWFGDVQVIKGVDLAIEDGEFIIFVGPSGCGKSTLLRMIGGLEEISRGSLEIDGKDVTSDPPSKRGLTMVFQSYALYPHMSVRDNMGFSLKTAGAPKAEIDAKVNEAARVLKLEDYLDRRPKALSGGQRQRVAIGRSIVRDPTAFLFDEPLSNLDAALRVEMRYEIAKLHQTLARTMIYVTHDQVEAMTLADKIVVLRLGVIEQVGAPLELYRDPDNKFVAGFIGSPAMNFMSGTVRGGAIDVPALGMSVNPDITLPSEGRDVIVGLRPEHAEIDQSGDAFTVELTEALGGVSYAYLTAKTGEKLIIEERGDIRSKIGDTVSLNFEMRRVYAFNAETDARIR